MAIKSHCCNFILKDTNNIIKRVKDSFSPFTQEHNINRKAI